MIFGVLKSNSVITDVEEAFITVAQSRGHEAYVFIAKNVDFENKKIFGKTLKSGRTVEFHFDFPDIIQNRLSCLPEDKETYLKLADLVPFTNNRIGTKLEVERKLEKIPSLTDFLLKSEKVENFQCILDALGKYKKIILKPIIGNQGKGIYTLTRTGGGCILKQLNEESFLDWDALSDLYEKQIKGKGYVASRFFESRTQNGLTTVFRIHLNRGKMGKWQLIKFFPYVTLEGNNDIANGMQGALISTREKLFLEQFYPDAYEIIQDKIQFLFKNFTLPFQKQYPYRLDNLGIDLGIDQQGNVVIFEVNAGAGVGFMAYPVAKANVDYYEWLAVNAKAPFAHNFLPIHLKKKIS